MLFRSPMCTVHAELAEDPGDDTDVAEEADDTPDIDGSIDDAINTLPQDDVAEEV